MEIDWAVPCGRGVEPHPDNARIATLRGVGAELWYIREFPGKLTIEFAVQLAAVADGAGIDAPHQLHVSVINETGKMVAEKSYTLAVAFEAPKTDWPNTVIAPLSVEFIAESAGGYFVNFAIDNASKSVPLRLARKQAQTA